jgi:hypothetical protein
MGIMALAATFHVVAIPAICAANAAIGALIAEL